MRAPFPAAPVRSAGRRPGRAGFSLLEIVIAVSVATVLLLGTYLTLSSTFRAQDTWGRMGHIEERGRIYLGRVVAKIQTSNVLYVETASATVPRIDYQVPVKDGTGNYVSSSTGEINWGAHEASGDVIGNYHRIQFVQRGTLSEATIKKDLNKDGDQSDTLVYGDLSETTSGGRTFSPPLAKDVILQSGSYLADLNNTFDSDGDGTAANDTSGEDQMFVRLNDATGFAKQITANFWIYMKDSQNRYVTKNFREVIMLRNPQS